MVGESRALWNALVVFPCQQTRSQWRPDGCTVLELLIQRGVLDFKALTVEGVVLWLVGDWSDEVVLLCDLSGFHDLNGAPLAGSPVVAAGY